MPTTRFTSVLDEAPAVEDSVMPAASWSQYRQSIGDRSAMFGAIADRLSIGSALYPGSYVDVSPSTAIPWVIYVDTDARAARYFADADGVANELVGRTRPGAAVRMDFLRADYTAPLDVAEGSVDLLISLFAGPVWDHCGDYLRPGGWLLANASHGDASLAALDPRLRLIAVVNHRDGHYRLRTDDLGEYLIPKRPEAADADRIRRSGRGIAYTRSAFAYLFSTAESAAVAG